MGFQQWTEIQLPLRGPSFQSYSVLGLAGDPNNPDHLLVASSRGLVASTDGGLTWNFLGPDVYTSTVFVKPTDSGILYDVEIPPFALNAGLYRSIDGGVTFNAVHTGLPEYSNDQQYNTFAIDPAQPNILYVPVHYSDGHAPAQLWRSINSGLSWTQMSQPLGTVNILTVTIDPSNSSHLLLGTSDFGLLNSNDGGNTWSHVTTGNANAVYEIIYDGNTLFSATNGGAYRSSDNGTTWSAIPGSGGNQILSIAIDQQDSRIVFGSATGGNTFISKDGGNNWTPLGQLPGQIDSYDIVYDFKNDTVLATDIFGKVYSFSGALSLPPPLFTSGADTVDFNHLTDAQKQAIDLNPQSMYQGFGGNDVVTLPDLEHYQLTAITRWDPSHGFVAGDVVGQSYRIIGGDGTDILLGGDGTDILSGRLGADTIYGGGGDDTISPGFDDVRDTLDGGAGVSDTANYSAYSTALTVTLNGATPVIVFGSGSTTATSDTIVNFEVFRGGTGVDTVTGDSNSNTFSVTVDDVRDTFDGAAGSDTADFQSYSTALTVTLNGTTPVIVFGTGSTTATSDTIVNVENVRGGTGVDTVTGDSNNNVFIATVDDVRDTFDGAAGRDTANYSLYSVGLTVTLNGATPVIVFGSGSTTATSDTIVNVENFTGGSGADKITGDNNSNSFRGGLGADTFVYAAGSGADTITDFKHTDGDRIDLIGLAGINSLADVQSHATQIGFNTFIDFGGGNTLTLSNVAKTNLVAADFGFATASPASFTISGRFEYQDRDYNEYGFTATPSYKAIRYATVQIWEDNGGPDDVPLGTIHTAADGTWSFDVLDNNDPFGRDIYVKVFADTAAGTVTNAGGSTYVYKGTTVSNWQGGAMWYDASPLDGSNQAVNPATDEYNAAFNILDQLVTGYQYLVNNGHNPDFNADHDGTPGHVTAQYVTTTLSTDYNRTTDTIRIENSSLTDNRFDDSVILHEYGHFAADNLSYLNDVGQPHSWDSQISPALAWNEGWATFFSSAVRNFPYYVDTSNVDQQTGGLYSYSVNIESGTVINGFIDRTKFVGDNNETAVAMVLWDVFDSTNESFDTMSDGIDEILNIISNQTYFSSSNDDNTLYDFYQGWRQEHYPNLDGLREILGFRQIFYWPVVTSISDSPDPVTTSGSLTLTAHVIETHNALANVSFYRESNGLSGLQIGPGGDLLVGQDSTAANGWSIAVNMTGTASGTYTYYALATDTSEDISATDTAARLTINTVSGLAVDGYIVSATIFADADSDSVLDPGEISTTTNATGAFLLLSGTGPLVLTGGIDIATNLPFQGHLNAPEGSSVITPLTTLIVALAGQGFADANAKVLTAFGFDPATDLATLDPVAGTSGGDAQAALAYTAGIEVFDTLTMLASVLAGNNPASYGGAFDAVLDALSDLIVAHGAALNLTDSDQIKELIDGAAAAGGFALDASVRDGSAAIVAALNQAVEDAGGATGVDLLAALSAIALVAQGAAADVLKNVGDALSDIGDALGGFTGGNLAMAIDAAKSQTGDVDGPGIQNAPNAHDDGYATDEDTALFITAKGILANDTDADGDALAAILVAGPSHGTLSFNENGSFNYAPDHNYNGPDSFTYKTNDGSSDSNIATVNLTINPVNDAPTVAAASSVLTQSIGERANLTGSAATDTTAGVVVFTDPDLTDQPTATIDTAHQTATWQDASHVYALTPAQVALFEQAFSISAPASNSNTGSIGWSYSLADNALDFLAVGESLILTTPVIIDDHYGGMISQNLVVTLNGSNDNPLPAADSNGIAKGTQLTVTAVKGVLANDSDPDLHDQGHFVVSAVNGSAANVGHAVAGSYGNLTLNADGSYNYLAGKGGLPANFVAQDSFNFAISDGHGGVAASTLSMVVFNPSMSYQAGVNTTLTGGNGDTVLDGSAGHDVMIGGNGADVLIGGNGDKLTGGNGPDTFLFRPNFGSNTITDFNVNNDVLQFDKSIFTNVTDILNHTTNSGAGAVISDGHGDAVTLTGVTVAQLQAHLSDFHLI